MTYGSANQNTGMATPITNVSESSTPSRTTLPAEITPSTRQPTSEHQFPPHNFSHNEHHSPCCMHVHQQQSQTCKPGEPLTLREVKHQHNDRTSVSRIPLIKQDRLSQFSSCFEGIGHFPRDPCKFYLKSDHQPAIHASQKPERYLQTNTEKVNTHTNWAHSNRERMECTRHFPAPMETCMSNHLTQTTERTQQQHLLPDFTCRHAEFRSDMESAPNFPGKQILQGNESFTVQDMENTPTFLRNEKIMDTGTFTLGNTSEQVSCMQHTHTSRDGKFQHGGISKLQLLC